MGINLRASRCGYCLRIAVVNEVPPAGWFLATATLLSTVDCPRLVRRRTGNFQHLKWNFEKFLISPHGAVAGRFRSQVEPHDADLDAAIEAVLLRRPGASGHDGVRRLSSPPTP